MHLILLALEAGRQYSNPVAQHEYPYVIELAHSSFVILS